MSNVKWKFSVALLILYACSAFANGDDPSASHPQHTGNSKPQHTDTEQPIRSGEENSEDAPSQFSSSSVDKQLNSKEGQKEAAQHWPDIDSMDSSDVNKYNPGNGAVEGNLVPNMESAAQTESLQNTEHSEALPDVRSSDTNSDDDRDEPIQPPSSDSVWESSEIPHEQIVYETEPISSDDPRESETLEAPSLPYSTERAIIDTPSAADSGGTNQGATEQSAPSSEPTVPAASNEGETNSKDPLTAQHTPPSQPPSSDEGESNSEEPLPAQHPSHEADPTPPPAPAAASDEEEATIAAPTTDQAVGGSETLAGGEEEEEEEESSELHEEPPVSPPPTQEGEGEAGMEGPPPHDDDAARPRVRSEGVLAEGRTGRVEEQPPSEEEEEGGASGEDEPADDLFNEGAALIGKADMSSKKRGYEVMLKAAGAGNSKAKERLAYGYLFGYVLERNFTRAFEIFTDLAADGSPAGQQGLGFMYSTGIGVNSSQAKAVLHYTFAALGGHHYAQMAMGYRALMGISVVQSCESALSYYYKAATKVIKESSPITGGHGVSKVRLLDEEDEDSNGYDEMVQYHSVFADSGNKGTQLLLGVLYMFGMGGAERSFKMALQFFQQAADEGLPDANAYIGKIYAEGSDEVPKDYTLAHKYFEKAASQKHPDGYSGLGLLYFYGMGVEESYKTALEYFQKGSERGSTDAQYYLGHMHLNGYGVRRDASNALKYFQLASHGGHLLAIYSLGEMHAEGTAVKRNCNYAVELLKVIAERGKWTRMFEEAEKLYNEGDLDSALMVYLLFSELGVEIAQANAAYLLEQEDVILVDKNETLKRALVLWNRAAIQGYSEARVKLGDYYYYGLGTGVNYEAAASQYRIASDKLSSAQAMFNLGYMYEQGLGLVKDYHLAKRYYDMAAETSSEAIIPVNLALFKMNLVSFYGDYYKYLSTAEFAVAVEQVEAVFGSYWDYYLITLLSGLVVMLFLWRRR